MKKIKEITENKIFKAVAGTLKVLLVIFVLAFILVVYLQRFTDNRVSILKYRMFTVASESMKPQYTVGDVLFAKETDPSKIKVNDDITYEGKIGDVRDKIVTHRVVNIEKDSSGKHLFHTKGLANLIEDPVVSEEDVFGVVVYKSFILSIVYKIVATNTGFYLCIIVPLLFIITNEAVSTLVEKEEKKRAKKE